MLEAHLTPDCSPHGLCTAECAAPVKQAPWGAWYITMGHAGFNSPANNAQGYGSAALAVAAHRRYAGHTAKREG
jgi:hypothetical protein